MTREEYENSLYLAHHGVKGQRWGVRRYQNEDGTLTEEGRKRYYVDADGNIQKISRKDKRAERKEIRKIGREFASEKKKNRDEEFSKHRTELAAKAYYLNSAKSRYDAWYKNDKDYPFDIFGVKASYEKAEKDMNNFTQSLDAAAQKKTYDAMVKKYGKEKIGKVFERSEKIDKAINAGAAIAGSALVAGVVVSEVKKSKKENS